MFNTPVVHPDPIQHVILNAAGEVVETAVSQQEAYGVIDYLTRTAPTAGPYRTRLALVTA